MDKHILSLTQDQLHEVYNAMWREFVALHDTATINRHGLTSIHAHERIRLAGHRQAPKETAGGRGLGLGQIGGCLAVGQLAQLDAPCTRLSQLLEHMSS